MEVGHYPAIEAHSADAQLPQVSVKRNDGKNPPFPLQARREWLRPGPVDPPSPKTAGATPAGCCR
jgi:hypothetical protein